MNKKGGFRLLTIVLLACFFISQLQPTPVLAQAGFIITPLSGLITSEAGVDAQFTVALAAQPLTGTQVTINLQSSNTNEGLPSPTSITFDEFNWNTSQTVTVSGVDDPYDDGDQNYSIITDTAISADPDYSGLNPDDVSLTNLDNDTAGILITPSGTLTTSEGGQSDTFQVRLASQPYNPVTITLLSSDTSEGSVVPPTLSFLTSTWQTNQTVTVTGVDDALFDGTQSYTIGLTASSSDAGYNGKSATVNAQNIDNEQVIVTAQPDNYTLTQGTELSEPAPGVLSNDTIIGGPQSSLTAILDIAPAHGTLTNFRPDGSFDYVPNPVYYGPDSFTYHATNGSVNSSTVTVSLAVNQQVVITAVDDSYTTNQVKPLNPPAPGVLANDTIIGGPQSSLSAIKDTEPAHGTVSLKANGSFTYTPAPGYFGPDYFTYHATNGQVNSDPATVSLNVSISTVIAHPDTYITDENIQLNVPSRGVLTNDSTNSGNNPTAKLVDNVMHGTLALKPDGSFKYTPFLNYIGVDTFTYRAVDGLVESDPPTLVTINIAQTNLDPVAVDDSYNSNATHDHPFIVSAPGVLSNDSDPEGQLLVVSIISQPNHGTVKNQGFGAFTYTPPPGFEGLARFDYQIQDPGGRIATARVNITIDTVAPPAVEWVTPNIAGTYNLISSPTVQLEVALDPGVTDIDRVEFKRWDTTLNQYIPVDNVNQYPYKIIVNLDIFNFGWNQVDAYAFDLAGNSSARSIIWLKRTLPPVAYFPIISKAPSAP